MATAKTIATGQAAQPSEPMTDGTLNFDVEMEGLQEAEACLDRLLRKRQLFNDLGATASEQKLLDQMDMLAERSREASAFEVDNLTNAMISINSALTGL